MTGDCTMKRALLVGSVVFLVIGCQLPEERAPVKPLPEDIKDVPAFAELLTRARRQATAATESFYVNKWTELEDQRAGWSRRPDFWARRPMCLLDKRICCRPSPETSPGKRPGCESYARTRMSSRRTRLCNESTWWCMNSDRTIERASYKVNLRPSSRTVFEGFSYG